jgi:hypothetical protein
MAIGTPIWGLATLVPSPKYEGNTGFICPEDVLPDIPYPS